MKVPDVLCFLGKVCGESRRYVSSLNGRDMSRKRGKAGSWRKCLDFSVFCATRLVEPALKIVES